MRWNNFDLPTQKVQTIICSPPYYNLRDYKRKDQIGLEPTENDSLENLYKTFDNMRRFMCSDGSLFVELGDYAPEDRYTGLLERFCLGMIDRKWHLRERIPVIRRNWGTNRKILGSVLVDALFLLKRARIQVL